MNRRLSEFYAPNLREIGNDILFCNRNLCKLNLPNLEKIGNCFLYKNRQLNEFYAPNLIEVGSRFLECNKSLSQFYAPNLNEKSKERMKAFLRKNLEKNKFDSLYVEPKDIAELDKESKITSSEINNVQKVLEDTLKENIEKELVK